MRKRLLSVLLLAVMLVNFLAVPAQAVTTEYHIKFNEQKKLYLSTSQSVTKAEWTTNNSAVVDIVESSLLSCTVVGVDNQKGQSALITCHYWYLLGGRIFQSYEYFRVYVPEEDSGSSGGTSTSGSNFSSKGYMYISASTVTLDLAKNPSATVRVKLLNGAPQNTTWYFDYMGINDNPDDPAKVNVKIEPYDVASKNFVLTGEETGTKKLVIYFYLGDDAFDQVDLYVKVICSHKWVQNEPDPAPSCTEDGRITGKTCSVCGAEEALDIVIPSVGHDWTEWEIYQEPTQEAEGIARRTCACGAYEEEPLEKLPADPAPSEPAATEPDSTEPAPSDPTPTEPAATEPAPSDPAATEPASTEPAPSEPAATEPASTEPAPSDPTPTEPASTEPAPSEPAATDPAPTEPAPTDPAEPPALENPFVDVAEGKFYYDPVLWAYYGGITTGRDATHFDPGGYCTRAQVVTFLWRAAGKPAPKSLVNPFPDVPAGKYYTDAVLWAVEQGITAGYKDGTFGPDDACTRGQIVTFLWRFAGKPEPKTLVNPFPDVAEGKFYYKAVLWAVEQGITGGFKDGTFGPDKTCTRDQIVTFLYRAMKE